jgi:HPt (histidine-containing phosphotransfer) domain-containing protein
MERLEETLERHGALNRSYLGHTAGRGEADLALDAEEMAGLPGIDLYDTLRRLAGNRPLYSRMARMACSRYADIRQQVEQLVSSGDTAAAVRLLHTFKGVMISLGAFSLGELTGTIETALAEGHAEEPLRPLFARLSTLTAEAISSLRIVADRYDKPGIALSEIP